MRRRVADSIRVGFRPCGRSGMDVLGQDRVVSSEVPSSTSVAVHLMAAQQGQKLNWGVSRTEDGH